jgi:NAD(P)-dependent dehydrogenase (short-subunit alcohol dehydrogenase family)
MTDVLVTGANRGIGLEFVRQYKAQGARVYACCRTPEKADDLNRIAQSSKGKVTLHRLDVTSEDDIKGLVNVLDGAPLDILINNAGISGDLHMFEPAEPKKWEEVLRVNTIAPFRIAWSLRSNLEKGTRKIINISSGRGSHSRHRGDGIAYCSSKAALNSSMFGLSVLWKELNFIIVMFAPGVVITDLNPGGRLTPEFSVGHMCELISGFTLADSGRYLNYEGKEVLW